MVKKPRIKKHVLLKKKSIVPLIAIVTTVLIIIFLVTIDYNSIDDKRKAREYKPTAELESLITKMRLTDQGKTILYASSPQLKDKKTFNGICGNDGDPDAFIAGCYYLINQEEYIDIYDSGKEATELQKAYYDYDKSKIVTLAHEMMHAAFSRLPEKQKEELEIDLNKVHAENAELRSEIGKYPSSEKYNELYVRVATEVYNIPSSLEKHYATYFIDRQYIAKMYHDNKKQLEEMLAEANVILERMETQRSLYENSNSYYTRRDAANEYNRLLELYNAHIGVYRDTYEKLDSEK